jgi:hypothetical protein
VTSSEISEVNCAEVLVEKASRDKTANDLKCFFILLHYRFYRCEYSKKLLIFAENKKFYDENEKYLHPDVHYVFLSCNGSGCYGVRSRW